MLLRHEGDQVHALRSQPAGVDRHVIAQRVCPIGAEEALVELASLQVGLFDQRPSRIFGQPAMLHHPPETNLCVRDQTDVKRPRVILQEPATAATDEEPVSLGSKLPHKLAERLEAPLVQAARTKALEDPGRPLVDQLQLRQADTQPPLLVREQLAVEHRQLGRWASVAAKLESPAPSSPVNVMIRRSADESASPDGHCWRTSAATPATTLSRGTRPVLSTRS